MDHVWLGSIAVGMMLEVNVLGQLTGADVLCLALFPFLVIKRGRLLARREALLVLMLSFLWLGSQVLTDVIVSTPFEDWSRGWARIVIFTIGLSTCLMLTRLNLLKALLFVQALAAAGAMKLFIGVGKYDLANQDLQTGWKFGYGYLAGVAALTVVWRLTPQGRRLSAVDGLPFGAAIVALAFNARSMFGLTALAAIVQVVTRFARRLSKLALSGYAVGFLLAAALLVMIYSQAASMGILGASAQIKYEQQADSDVGILGGRKELLGSSQAIIDSPLIGHGSWAKDPRYIDVMLTRMAEVGLAQEGSIAALYENPLIPTHSHILGAWVEAGLFGALFWIVVLVLVVRALAIMLRRPPPQVGLISFVLVNFIWDLVFSPFGLDRRIIDAGMICLALATLSAFGNRGKVVAARLRYAAERKAKLAVMQRRSQV